MNQTPIRALLTVDGVVWPNRGGGDRWGIIPPHALTRDMVATACGPVSEVLLVDPATVAGMVEDLQRAFDHPDSPILTTYAAARVRDRLLWMLRATDTTAPVQVPSVGGYPGDAEKTFDVENAEAEWSDYVAEYGPEVAEEQGTSTDTGSTAGSGRQEAIR